ncbi:MAG: methyltransferase domain-containing protein [Planctomycetes bacterium]|nr:methyltransferase domain-containing protein [Planctomycetota bacterium]
MSSAPPDPGSMYEALARFQWLRRRWSRARSGTGLEMRKRLLPTSTPGVGPADGAEGLDRWLHSLLGGRRVSRVLDVGCGFGISAQRWAAATGGEAVGITPSAFQVTKAAAEAASRGLGDRVRFVRQDAAAPLPGRFDVVLAIESLGHVNDLGAVLRNVHGALWPGGVLLWVEDLLVQPADGDVDVAELARRWSSPPLRDVATARRELAAAGFEPVREIDLTPQVPFASTPGAPARAARLSRWRKVPLSPLRGMIDAFLGGLALERLYARGVACYRVWMSERPSETA